MENNQPTIIVQLLELAARPEGVSTAEFQAITGFRPIPARDAMLRLKKQGRIFSKAGLDARGVYIKRNFATQTAADAYEFGKHRHIRAEGRTQKTRDEYLAVLDVPRSYRELEILTGRGNTSVVKSVQRMVNLGFLHIGKTRHPQTTRPVHMVFTSLAARDAWQLENPYLEVVIKREPKPRKLQPPSARTRRAPRTATSVVKRKDSAIAEMLSRRSIKAFEVAAKPVEYVLTDDDKAKIKRIESAPGLGNRYYVPPSEVPMTFASLRPGQYLEVTA
jgi:hypothetical protein